MADGSGPDQTAEMTAQCLPDCLSAANLEGGGIMHGFFLRVGGVSEGLYASLNCGRGSRDASDCVEVNRARVAARLGVPSSSLIGPRQIHSAKAIIATEAWPASRAPEADAIVTDTRGIAIAILTADCAPVLIADPEAGVIGAAHAGWKGAKAGVLESAINAMESLGGNVSRMVAAIGPTISRAAYEVGPDFRASFLSESASNDEYFSVTNGGSVHFDLPAYVKARLSRRGIDHLQDLAVCTYENESILYSYRRAYHRSEPDYGRQISAIVLR